MSSSKKVDVLRIWVDKAKLKAAFRTLTEDQTAVIAANTVKSLPDDYELFPTDEVKAVLTLAAVEWRDTKLKSRTVVLPAEGVA